MKPLRMIVAALIIAAAGCDTGGNPSNASPSPLQTMPHITPSSGTPTPGITYPPPSTPTFIYETATPIPQVNVHFIFSGEPKPETLALMVDSIHPPHNDQPSPEVLLATVEHTMFEGVRAALIKVPTDSSLDGIVLQTNLQRTSDDVMNYLEIIDPSSLKYIEDEEPLFHLS